MRSTCAVLQLRLRPQHLLKQHSSMPVERPQRDHALSTNLLLWVTRSKWKKKQPQAQRRSRTTACPRRAPRQGLGKPQPQSGRPTPFSPPHPRTELQPNNAITVPPSSNLDLMKTRRPQPKPEAHPHPATQALNARTTPTARPRLHQGAGWCTTFPTKKKTTLLYCSLEQSSNPNHPTNNTTFSQARHHAPFNLNIHLSPVGPLRVLRHQSWHRKRQRRRRRRR